MKKYAILTALLLSGTANSAVTLPSLPYIATDGNVTAISTDVNVLPILKNNEYIFNTSALKIDIISLASGYSLTATGNATILFDNAANKSLTVSSPVFSLVANFNSSSVFDPTGSTLTITGNVNNGANSLSGTLYSADLTGFGYNTTNTRTIGFSTRQQSLGANNPIYNPNWSVSDISETYVYGSSSAFGFLVNALQAHNLATVVKSYNLSSISAMTVVETQPPAPVPLPIVSWLFLTGLLFILYVGKRKNKSVKSYGL